MLVCRGLSCQKLSKDQRRLLSSHHLHHLCNAVCVIQKWFEPYAHISLISSTPFPYFICVGSVGQFMELPSARMVSVTRYPPSRVGKSYAKFSIYHSVISTASSIFFLNVQMVLLIFLLSELTTKSADRVFIELYIG